MKRPTAVEVRRPRMDGTRVDGLGRLRADRGRLALAWLEGAWIAFAAPLWVQGPRLRRLVGSSPGETASPPEVWQFSGTPEPRVRAALGMLRLLARLPRSPWRNTCLYRSIVVCRCLHARGVAARVALGARHLARTEGPGADAPATDAGLARIAAHAWVEAWEEAQLGTSGRAPAAPPTAHFTPFRASRGVGP